MRTNSNIKQQTLLTLRNLGPQLDDATIRQHLSIHGIKVGSGRLLSVLYSLEQAGDVASGFLNSKRVYSLTAQGQARARE